MIQNKYFCCIEYFKISEKLEFGIKVYNSKIPYKERYEDFEFFFSLKIFLISMTKSIKMIVNLIHY